MSLLKSDSSLVHTIYSMLLLRTYPDGVERATKVMMSMIFGSMTELISMIVSVMTSMGTSIDRSFF